MTLFRSFHSMGKSPNFRGIFNGLCVLVVCFFFYNRVDVLRNPILSDGSGQFRVIHRRTIELGVNASNSVNGSEPIIVSVNDNRDSCIVGRYAQEGYGNECDYLRANPNCSSGGFIDYLSFFYCDCQKFRILGYVVLGIWLAALFYLLGNTAADYFCCSLEKLSCLLKLSPTVAGVVLLPLGNGAPDVFASIAAFVGTDAGDMGLNSVLGGAVFVTCIVVGTISLFVAKRGVQIDQKCFIRDIGFFLLTIVALLVILIIGKLGVVMAISFVAIYAIYAFFVAANELLRKHARRFKLEAVTPLLPIRGSVFAQGSEDWDKDVSIHTSLLDMESENTTLDHPPTLPQWMWASNVAIYSNHGTRANGPDHDRPPWGWTEEDMQFKNSPSLRSKLISILEIPLSLPRRLTIPLVEEESWSKAYAVASAFLAPMLLSFLWSTQENVSFKGRLVAYFIGFSIGFPLTILAYLNTVPDHPPQRFKLLWVLGGFFMSIAWFYIVATELVALLVTFGTILGISPSILALTVLAWGNSMGDLMSNVALALNSDDGVQIALSGSYAGPMFNTIVGLGVSMLLGAWAKRPDLYVIPKDGSLFYTIGFLVTGLVWALIVLLRNDMQPNRTLGVGLITVYAVFLSLRVSGATGDF